MYKMRNVQTGKTYRRKRGIYMRRLQKPAKGIADLGATCKGVAVAQSWAKGGGK